MKSISVARYPVTEEEQNKLRTLFADPGYELLRDIISSHCNEAQVAYLDAMLYDNQAAEQISKVSLVRAKLYNDTLDVLDELQAKMDEWYKVKVETRR